VIFAFVEDGSVEIKRDLAEVRRDFEAIDVENFVVAFYDENGTPLEPVPFAEVSPSMPNRVAT
jgi:hypothetical protein